MTLRVMNTISSLFYELRASCAAARTRAYGHGDMSPTDGLPILTRIHALNQPNTDGHPQCYVALVLLSPAPRQEHPSEKTYRSASSPTKHLPIGSIADAPSLDLSIIVPAYNETERLPSMLQDAIDHLTKSAPKGRTHEFVVVDDGSTDGTAELALKFAVDSPRSDIRVVQLLQNAGKGGAVRHGMLHARGRRLLMVDADGATRFADLEDLWKEMDEIAHDGEASVVVGSRAHLVKTEAVVKVRSPSSLVFGV